eukprot:SAG31_NODE_1548_length_7914_cov_5.353423_2_plen_66_part_00
MISNTSGAPRFATRGTELPMISNTSGAPRFATRDGAGVLQAVEHAASPELRGLPAVRHTRKIASC